MLACNARHSYPQDVHTQWITCMFSVDSRWIQSPQNALTTNYFYQRLSTYQQGHITYPHHITHRLAFKPLFHTFLETSFALLE